MLKAGVFRASISHQHAVKKHDENLVLITVSAASGEAYWEQMKTLVVAMKMVMAGYPGLGKMKRHLVTAQAGGKTSTIDLQRIIKNSTYLDEAGFADIHERMCVKKDPPRKRPEAASPPAG